jgi:transcriptional regulator with XRE-family HTH domain
MPLKYLIQEDCIRLYNLEGKIDMVDPMALTLKAKKLSVLLRDARQTKGRSLEECAQAIAASVQTYEAYEDGQQSPSFPEVELLAFFLDIPVEHFIQSQGLLKADPPKRVEQISELLQLRRRMIGVLLRKARLEAGISLEQLAEICGISFDELNACEMGGTSLDLPHLELISDELGCSLPEFKDQHGPVGRWITQNQGQKEFSTLPNDLQAFISDPNNRPYLQAAQQLSQIPLDQLRLLIRSLQVILHE